ncbi:MAG: hypothetical protein K9M81_04490 [Chthoniobacterales bacterium]|nr:hypothetical protein [Chthoniobacterales bacterium]
MESVGQQSSTGGLKDILNLDKDTREVSINGNRYVAGGEKPTGFFSSLTMAFRCFFRSNDEESKNNAVFRQVVNDINIFLGKVGLKNLMKKCSQKLTWGLLSPREL